MEKTIKEIREHKLFRWEAVKPFTLYQTILSFLIPSAIATVLFHVALPKLVSGGLSPIVAWPIVACFGLTAIVGFAFWRLRKEAAELNVNFSERMLFSKLSGKQWGLYIGILIIGIALSAVVSKWIVSFMNHTGLSAPDYYPFWLNPAFDMGIANPKLSIQGITLSGAFWIIPIMILTLLLNILAEEFYFKAWLLPKMHQLHDWAWILNGLLFALYHVFQIWLMPVILPMSLIMAFVTWHSKSVWPGLLIHLIVNFFGAIVNIIIMIAG